VDSRDAAKAEMLASPKTCQHPAWERQPKAGLTWKPRGRSVGLNWFGSSPLFRSRSRPILSHGFAVTVGVKFGPRYRHVSTPFSADNFSLRSCEKVTTFA
jgi:hypothetical protein